MIPAGLASGVGMQWPGWFDFKYAAEEAPFREAWAHKLRMRIEDYEAKGPQYPFGWRSPRTLERARKDIQCQKERIATYLTGSRKGIPSPLYAQESFYLAFTHLAFSWTWPSILDELTPASLDLYDCFTRRNLPYVFAVGCILMLWVLNLFQFEKWSKWNGNLAWAAEAIREACKNVDLEKGGIPRKELEWWIEAILTEATDSAALAKERKEKIIAPILGMICSNWEVAPLGVGRYDESGAKMKCTGKCDCGYYRTGVVKK